jgi:hypothetical protein
VFELAKVSEAQRLVGLETEARGVPSLKRLVGTRAQIMGVEIRHGTCREIRPVLRGGA